MKELNKENLKDFTKTDEFKEAFKKEVTKDKNEMTEKNKETDLKGCD